MKKYLFITLCFFVFKSNAQIYYQDISPDYVLNTWNAYNLQIDSPVTKTGNASLTIWEDFNTQTDVLAYANCEVLMNAGYPAALNTGQSITSSATWQAPNYSILFDGTNGNWQNKTDKYLGLRIKEGGLWYYGWVRLDVNNSGNSVTIKDYACNMTAGDSILAGQTSVSTGIAVPELEKVSMMMLGETLIFTDMEAKGNSNVIIYGMDGKVVLRKTLVNSRVQIDEVSKGLYIVLLQSGNYRKTFKMVL